MKRSGTGADRIGIMPDMRRNQIDLIDRALQLKDGGRLREGSLRLLVFIGSSGHAVGASIQIQGSSPQRNRKICARYDLDVVSLSRRRFQHLHPWFRSPDPETAERVTE